MPYVDGQWVEDKARNKKLMDERAAKNEAAYGPNAAGVPDFRVTKANSIGGNYATNIRPGAGGGGAASAPSGYAASGAPGVGGAGGGVDLSGLFKSLGSAPTTGSTGTATPDFTSTVQEDPRITGWSDAVLKRATNPGESTGHAINVAGSAIRDASEGRKKALRAGAASRGALAGSTIPQIGEAALGAQEGRDINAAATNISLGREKDADQLLLGAGDAAKAPGQQKMAAQDQNRMQWQAVEQNKRAQEASELQAYLGKLDVIGKFANLAAF